MLLFGLQAVELLAFPLCLFGFALALKGAIELWANVLFLKIVRMIWEEAEGQWIVFFANADLELVVVLGWHPNEQAARSGATNRLAQVRTASSRFDNDELYIVRPDGSFYQFSETTAATA